jgi:glycerophosphoryl diester phosphodiesterase
MLHLLLVSMCLCAAPAVSETILIVAHRGSSADRPENTMAAYRRAIEAGAGAIEVDLRQTKDGHLVSLHDARLDRTTNGSGPLASVALAEVLQLDAGSGERVPTFPQILELAKGRVDVLLDLKGQGNAYLERIIEEVRQVGEPRRIIVGVRSVEDAFYFRRHLPEARQVGLIPTPADLELFVKAGVEVVRLWPAWLADRTLIPRLQKAGAGLLVSVGKGTREEVRPVLPARPVMLFTDDPARLAQTLKSLDGSR